MDPSQVPAATTAPTEPTQDELEWASAADDFVSDSGANLDEKKKESTDEPAKPEKTPEEIAADEAAAKAKTGDEEQKPGDDPEKKTGSDPEKSAEGSEPTVRDRLAEEAELKQTREAITQDVRTKLFSDKPTRLEDADGDPIESIADVMKLQNPATGKPFTAEEAAGWLLRAQDHFEKQSRKDQGEIDKIVEVNVTMKYDLEAIKSEYGELLKHLPNLRQKLSETFAKTLEVGSDGETIVGTKIGMKEFYDVALAPYMKQVKEMEASDAAKSEADKKAADEAAKQAQEQQQKQTRSDRGDVFSTRTKVEDMTDPEEKSWASAAKEYYEG